MRGVRAHNLADDETVKQHAYRGQVLLYGRFCKPFRNCQKPCDVIGSNNHLGGRTIIPDVPLLTIPI